MHFKAMPYHASDDLAAAHSRRILMMTLFIPFFNPPVVLSAHSDVSRPRHQHNQAMSLSNLTYSAHSYKPARFATSVQPVGRAEPVTDGHFGTADSSHSSRHHHVKVCALAALPNQILQNKIKTWASKCQYPAPLSGPRCREPFPVTACEKGYSLDQPHPSQIPSPILRPITHPG